MTQDMIRHYKLGMMERGIPVLTFEVVRMPEYLSSMVRIKFLFRMTIKISTCEIDNSVPIRHTMERMADGVCRWMDQNGGNFKRRDYEQSSV